MKKQHNYLIYPTLLDAYQRFVDADAEDYFWKDEQGKWHRNYNEEEGTFHYSQEEVDSLMLQELLDKINRKPFEPSEAASKGTIFNEIVDCIISNRNTENNDMFIASAVGYSDFIGKVFNARHDVDEIGKEILAPYEEVLSRIDKPFIYGAIDGFEFYFDKEFCKSFAGYFNGALSQYYVNAPIETDYGSVLLYGYVDELMKDKVYDIKTTKSYSFGNYKKYWQRHVYPYCLVESGECTDISSFEFTVAVLKGGTPRTPLITGDVYREVYDYNHDESRKKIRQQCERFIEFLELHRDEISDNKIFGNDTN